jgi:hypothetical protein
MKPSSFRFKWNNQTNHLSSNRNYFSFNSFMSFRFYFYSCSSLQHNGQHQLDEYLWE